VPDLSSKLLAFLAGLISASFGAGITFATWSSSHPTRTEIADALGCAAYGSSLETCPVARDAKESRREVMELQGEIKALRKDLSRGFGRSLSVTVPLRDEAGKRALRMFESEISQGIAPVDAFRHVIESDF
jgi:hypothetical protein